MTQATVIPHVKILAQFQKVDKIYLITIERNTYEKTEFINEKIRHITFHSRRHPVPLWDKLSDFIKIPRILTRLIKKHHIEKIIARGTPAGALAYIVWNSTKTPFYVESFEPHADYMLETGVWPGWDPRYIFQKRWEKKQLQYSSGLMPVAENYTKEIIRKDATKKIFTMPCGVDWNFFRFNEDDRVRVRSELNISDQKVLIYTGKFGGIYMYDETFKLFKQIKTYFGNLFLIILTPDADQDMTDRIADSWGQADSYVIKQVRHTDIPAYLSASDFALAIYKQFNSSQFLSPVKIGEYWASGLPVLLTRGVGDETNFIEREGGGALLDIDNPDPSFKKIQTILTSPDHRQTITSLAKKYRSFGRVKKVYQELVLND